MLPLIEIDETPGLGRLILGEQGRRRAGDVEQVDVAAAEVGKRGLGAVEVAGDRATEKDPSAARGELDLRRAGRVSVVEHDEVQIVRAGGDGQRALERDGPDAVDGGSEHGQDLGRGGITDIDQGRAQSAHLADQDMRAVDGDGADSAEGGRDRPLEDGRGRVGDVVDRDLAAVVVARGGERAGRVYHATALEGRRHQNLGRACGRRDVDDREAVVVVAAGHDDVPHCHPLPGRGEAPQYFGGGFGTPDTRPGGSASRVAGGTHQDRSVKNELW